MKNSPRIYCNIFTYYNLCACVFQESEDRVSLRYHFVTSGGNIQGSNFKHFCIMRKRTSYLENQTFLQQFRLLISFIS